MSSKRENTVELIPIEQINVVNSRTRGKPKFKQIVANISRLGLKKPITVARRKSRNGQAQYDLVCGQGRLEAFKALGQTQIPAIVTEASREELMLTSLAENLARRTFTSFELVKEIGALKDRGYNYTEIGRKTDLTIEYVRGIVRLLKQGEERLLQAVEKGQIPISVAITIATADDETVQRALTDAYESNSLRGQGLIAARRLIEKRRNFGKTIRAGISTRDRRKISSGGLLKTYHEETNRQRLLVKKAKLCETRLLFVISALKKLFEDENLVNLLRAESLDALPQYLADRLKGAES